VIYGILNNGKLDDHERPSRSFTYCKPFQMVFSYSCAAADKISPDSALCGSSAIAELLVQNVQLLKST